MSPLSIFFLTLATLTSSSAVRCPSSCDCGTRFGRKEIVCDEGGMTDPIPINDMDLDTEVVIITAPRSYQNHLTIGPLFQNFENLRELHITYSNIPAIGDHTFWGVLSLTVLDLSHNNISMVVESNLRGLSNVEKLYLNGNKIESMPSATFRYLKNLRFLDLADNRIDELVPRLFYSLQKLEQLDLSKNPLVELEPEVFKDIRGLKTLRCSQCGLSSVNSFIYNLLRSLEDLDLSFNNIRYLRSGEFKEVPNLKTLQLDGNQMTVIVDDLFNGHKLDLLTLSRNQLVKLSKHAFRNLSVTELDMSYNKLDKLERSVLRPVVPTLKSLDLSGNRISVERLHRAVSTLSHLREIELADSGIIELPPDMFSYLRHLQALNLSANYLTVIDPQIFDPLERLQVLDLSKNQFQGMDDPILDKLSSLYNLRTLHLHGNLWSCTICHIPPLHHWLKNENRFYRGVCRNPRNLNCLKCVQPYDLAGQEIEMLDPNNFRSCGGDDGRTAPNILPDDSQLGIIIACAIGLVLLVTIVVLIVLNNRHSAYYYTHEEDREEDGCMFENDSTLEENGDVGYVDNKKKASIATIDEITRDPLLNGSTKVNGNGVHVTIS